MGQWIYIFKNDKKIWNYQDCQGMQFNSERTLITFTCTQKNVHSSRTYNWLISNPCEASESDHMIYLVSIIQNQTKYEE